MPIDRVFTIHGFGTVVAGTVLSGQSQAGDRIEIYPESLKTRVRGSPGPQVQSATVRPRQADRAQPPGRRQGRPAARPGRAPPRARSLPTTRLDARLDVLAGAPTRDQAPRARPAPHRDGRGHGPPVRHRRTDDRARRHGGRPAHPRAPGRRPPRRPVRHPLLLPHRDDRRRPRARRGARKAQALQRRGPRGARESSGARPATPSSRCSPKSGGAPQAASISLGSSAAASPRSSRPSRRSRPTAASSPSPARSRDRYLHRSAYTASPTGSSPRSGAYFEKNPVPRRPCPTRTSGRSSSRRATRPPSSYSRRARRGTASSCARTPRSGSPAARSKADPAAAVAAPADRGRFPRRPFLGAARRRREDKPRPQPSAFNPVLSGLLRSGELVRLAPKVVYHRETVEAARAAVAGLIERRGCVTIAELRDRLELSRKYAQAILEYFDKTGFTKRMDDRHVQAKPPVA